MSTNKMISIALNVNLKGREILRNPSVRSCPFSRFYFYFKKPNVIDAINRIQYRGMGLKEIYSFILGPCVCKCVSIFLRSNPFSLFLWSWCLIDSFALHGMVVLDEVVPSGFIREHVFSISLEFCCVRELG